MKSLVLEAPYQVAVQEQITPKPAPDELLVATRLSAISPGTEMLVYRGQLPDELPLDATIATLTQTTNRYPLRYGYACVGQVVELGKAVEPGWLGRTVFGFHPHASDFVARPETLIPIPQSIRDEQAALYPNVETAVTFLLDGAPAIGERVVVFGAGVVGLLTTALLSRFPLRELTVIDPFPLRRQLARKLGAHQAFSPDAMPDALAATADLTYELSSNPVALNAAIRCTGFQGRVVIGSWYGQKRAPIDLGGYFHRSRIRLISSQVSTLPPERSGRWDRARRTEVAWQMLEPIDSANFITHRFAVEQAADAYQLIDRQPAETVQVLLTY